MRAIDAALHDDIPAVKIDVSSVQTRQLAGTKAGMAGHEKQRIVLRHFAFGPGVSDESIVLLFHDAQ
jgi:hypothetical protein